jgi:CBS domain containing-hemolysin-like protein
MEIAFVSSNKLKIELDKKQGKLSGKINSFFAQNPQRFIGAMLVGNNIVLVLYGIFAAELSKPSIILLLNSIFNAVSDGTVAIIQTILSTLLILITAEYLPKALFRINPNYILNVFSIPTYLFYWLLYPISFFTVFLSENLLRIIGYSKQKEAIVFGKTDLDNLIKEVTEETRQNPENLENEIKIFKNALDFGNVKARDCMIPRNEVIAADIHDSIAEIRAKFIETGLSKIMIFKDNIDNIIGYIHSFALFKSPQHIKDVLMPVLIVPETMPVRDVLTKLTKERKTVAIVVDEFGGTAGLLTIEDVIEEIFGEIEDEHDEEQLTEKVISENEYIFSGRIEIKYLNEKYELNIPESEVYTTLAGYIINLNQRIPEVDEQIESPEFIINITKASGSKIDEVHLKVIK